jgi:hypothetical protein
MESIMKPLSRHSANKGASASAFRRNVSTTKLINITAGPMRGGIRL